MLRSAPPRLDADAPRSRTGNVWDAVRAENLRLLADGWRDLGVSRRSAALEAPASEHLVHDVAAPGYREALEGRVRTLATSLDVCVYCAGVGEMLDVDGLERETDVVRVNLLGAAVDIILRAVRARPSRTSGPIAMTLVMAIYGLVLRVRLWWT